VKLEKLKAGGTDKPIYGYSTFLGLDNDSYSYAWNCILFYYFIKLESSSCKT